MSALFGPEQAFRALADSAGRMGAGESRENSVFWCEASHVLRRAADTLRAQMVAGCTGTVEG